MLKAELAVLADDVLRLEPEVQLHPEAQSDFDAAFNRYRAAQAALDYADEPVDLVRLARVVAEARYAMDRVRAMLDGREPPPPPAELGRVGLHGEPAVTLDEHRQPAYVGYPGGFQSGWFGGVGGGLFSGLLLGSMLGGGFGGWGHGGTTIINEGGDGGGGGDFGAAVTSVAATSVVATSVVATSVVATSSVGGSRTGEDDGARRADGPREPLIACHESGPYRFRERHVVGIVASDGGAEFPHPICKHGVRPPFARPRSHVLDRLPSCGVVEFAAPVLAHDHRHHLGIDEVRCRMLGIGRQELADSRRASCRGHDLEQRAGINDQHRARGPGPHRGRR